MEEAQNNQELNEEVSEELQLPAEKTYQEMFTEGVHLYELRNFEEASKVFLETHEKFPERAEVLINYGNCQYELFHTEEAVKYWKFAKEKDKYLINSYVNLGNYYLANSNLENAEEEFKQAFCLNPYNEISLVNLGITYEKLNDKKTAFLLYEFYLSNSLNVNDPNYKNIHKKITMHKLNAISQIKLGIFFEKKGFFRKALQSYFDSMKVFPNFAKTYRNAGNVFYKLEKYEHAKLYWMEAYKIDRKHISTCLNLALCCEKLEDYVNAYAFYKNFIEKTFKQNQEIILAQQAAEKIHQTLMSSSEYTKKYKELAESYANQKKFDEALIYYENLYSISPSSELIPKINELKTKTNILHEASVKSYEMAEELFEQGKVEYAMEKCKLANNLWRESYISQNISTLMSKCQTSLGNSLNNMLKAKH